MTPAGATRQTLVIPAWHPQTSANARGNWRVIHKRHHHDRDMAWAMATMAGWVFVPGRVRLTVTLVYSRKYRVDADNLAAKCKGILDGLKAGGLRHIAGVGQTRGWFEDDSTDVLELVVKAEVRPGIKQTEIALESLTGPAAYLPQAAGRPARRTETPTSVRRGRGTQEAVDA